MARAKTLNTDEAAKLLGTTRARAVSRLVALGYTVVCGRCCGSGRYSYCQMYGDTCFGCSGSGKKLARLTDKLVAEAKARIDAGELADYFARAKARGAIKGAVAKATKVWHESFISKTYSGPVVRALPAAIVVESPVFRAQGLVNDLWDEVNKAEDAARRGKVTDPRDALARIEALEAAIVEVDEAFKRYAAEYGLTAAVAA